MAGGTKVSCACPDTGTHLVNCSNDRICFFFLGLPLITKTRKKTRTDLDGSPERCPFCFVPHLNCNVMWNLVVYWLILMCTRFASGCHIGEPMCMLSALTAHIAIFNDTPVGRDLPRFGSCHQRMYE